MVLDDSDDAPLGQQAQPRCEQLYRDTQDSGEHYHLQEYVVIPPAGGHEAHYRRWLHRSGAGNHAGPNRDR